MPQGQNDKLVAALGYVIFLIPLLTPNRSPFVTFHANQGLVLFIFTMIAHFAISWFLIPLSFSFFLVFLNPIISLFVLYLVIVGIMSATSGTMKPLPLIGGITLLR